MPDENSTAQRHLTTEIVAAYIGRNQVAADQLPSLISAVHRALNQLGEPTAGPGDERTPAVSTRRSVHHDYVVCMDCAWKGSMLKRHLNTAHGLSVPEYRTRWDLAAYHPMTAPGYSERRSAVAKELGLGRRGRPSVDIATVPPTETQTTQPGPKRRGRPRAPRS